MENFHFSLSSLSPTCAATRRPHTTHQRATPRAPESDVPGGLESGGKGGSRKDVGRVFVAFYYTQCVWPSEDYSVDAQEKLIFSFLSLSP